MGKEKRIRKLRMKRNQNRKSMTKLMKQIRADRDVILLTCFIHGHEMRRVPKINNDVDVCIRCGELNKKGEMNTEKYLIKDGLILW